MKIFGQISEFWKKGKRRDVVYIISGILLVTLLYGIIYIQNNMGKQVDNDQKSVQTITTEQHLADILSQIEGAGEVSVMITYEDDPEDTVKSQSDEQEQVESSGSSLLFPMGETGSSNDSAAADQSSPRQIVKGVVVVAEGGDDLTVRLNLYSAVSTVLQINQNQIEVFTKNKT